MRLNVGGKEPRPGWTILNVQPGPHVDVIGSCTDMSAIGTAAVDELYASHVLEHLGHREELPRAFAEIFRVLKPNGRLMVAVPDLEILCQLFVHPETSPAVRWEVMLYMFGGQTDQFDFHKVGLWGDYLGRYLMNVGFVDVRRVRSFDLFSDASTATIGGVPISLNLAARKP